MLPPSLSRFFWDQEFDLLRWPEHREPVARRLLSAGDGPALAWLRAEVGDGWLRDLIRRTRGRDLDARRLRYWQVVLDLPDEDVVAWLADPARRLWEERVTR